tara:strand:+ start:791 stop:1009 length:219 start_codon:yes stop_codon:yes gene_type:complete
MEFTDTTLKRIIENERTVTQMESMFGFMKEEMGGCKNYITPSNDCKKYGIDFAGLTSAFLGCYLKLQEFKNK